MNRHLELDDRIGDLLHHPAFAGFAASILPGGSSSHDEGMRLREIGSLLPYHTHVNPAVVVAALNRMVDDASSGEQVFHEIYSAAQKRKESAKANTGLFFFRGTRGAPFAVIAPGGGFSYVGSVHEGFPYALEISRRGYNAFVLRYRVGHGGAVATEDMAAAITFIFRNAGTLGVSTRGYSLWGSSAGARMAAAIGTHGAAATRPRPRLGAPTTRERARLPLPSSQTRAAAAPATVEGPPLKSPNSSRTSPGQT